MRLLLVFQRTRVFVCSYLNPAEGLHMTLYSIIPPQFRAIPLLSGRALSESRIPCAYTKLFSKKEYVHPFYTDPQTSANSKAKFWPRGMYNPQVLNLLLKQHSLFLAGRMLGGCRLFPAVLICCSSLTPLL